MPYSPKIKTNKTNICWNNILFPIVQEIILVFSDIINEKNKNNQTLFVHPIENCSNNTIEIFQVTHTLINLLNKLKNNFKIINPNISDQMYNNLKLSNRHLTPRSTAIKLARYINAQYILYGVIYNNEQKINFKTQLIIVRTGEIIWSHTISF